jgi:predicted transcriptional regulator
MGIDKPSQTDFLKLKPDIVSAHIFNNSISTADLKKLIEDVYVSLSVVGRSDLIGVKAQPAVSPKNQSSLITLIYLENGGSLKMLKRHLKASYNLSPGEYRQRWGLDLNYPMVAPN